MRLLPLVVAVLLAAPPAQPVSGTSPAGLFYEISGSGEPVVFIHGFSVDRRMWRPQIEHFQSRFTVIRYDLRGHGRSAPTDAPYSAYEDLRDVLDAAGIRRAALVGLSAGAQVATNFALMYPERVSRLVLAAPGLGGYVPREPLTWLKPIFEAAAAGDAERAAKLWAEAPLMTLRGNQSAAAELKSLVADNARLWSYKSNPDRPLAPPAIQRLGEIRRPVLVVLGEEDLPHIADVASVLTAGIAGAKLVKLPGAGHFVNLDAPDPFNKAVEAFLNEP